MKKSIILPLKHLSNGEYGKTPDHENEAILHLADPMVQSFNYAVGQGLQTAITNIMPVDFTTPSNKNITISLTNVVIEKPRVPTNDGSILESRLFPRHCLESQSTYQGICTATIGWSFDNRRMPYVEMQLGGMPIMVKSDMCNLKGMKPAELLERGEEVNDPGGYFIINGSKKVIRLLTGYRRNYPIALLRDSWRHKQQFFTDKGVTIQCVGRDETGITNVLHYLTTGAARLEFFINKRPFLVDMVMLLKAFRDTNDREIVMLLGEMRRGDTFFIEKVKQMLSDLASRGLYTSAQCREFIGRSFRYYMRDITPSYYTDEQVCELLIERFIFIHLSDADSKFDLLCFMACKLYALIAGDTVGESLDVTSMMEAHLSGFLYLKYLKEKLHDMIQSIKIQAYVFLKGQPIDYVVTEADFKKWCLRARQVGSTVESFISTGNVASKTGLGLSQASGLTVILEGLNRMRDLSHLRAIHRGSYFLEMKTVAPRRLTGEAWGFICPVHTPDGAPCGLLNHLAFNCKIPAHPTPNDDHLLNTLLSLGMQPMSATTRSPASAFLHLQYPVLLDGRLVGHVYKTDARNIEFKLRTMKTSGEVYQFTEVVMVLQRPHGGQFPGLYLFTTPGRMMRPVVNLHTKSIEFVGTFEQVYLNVAISTDQIDKEVHTHVDVDKSQIFSNIGKLVPFSDCNPNPRNMYQCQMGKQTVGTPLHTWRSQMLNKAYRLQYPQVPLVRNAHYDVIDMQDHCMGFNAVLALVSYTGYDIEDAMTVNKSSMERGLGHSQVYKSEFVNLRNIKSRGRQTSEVTHIFNRNPEDPELARFLDPMGLPVPGTVLKQGDPYYCTQDVRSRAYSVMFYKGEKCVVDKVALVEVGNKDSCPQKMSVTLRAQRNPNIGDKFASRSGQKGVMSRLYPTEDLPFTERGIMPDIIFNPHGIPSRMTAGKLLEVIAGKSAAEYGLSFDSTPFEFSDENPAADYFGSILEKAGFNYYGEDVMYSGIDGRMLEVKVYQGIMYYQRLKHMTEDKYQVRSTGSVDAVTRQPVKGRKRGGAIRFGEMERDALLAHGAAFMLKDRLLDCSDSAVEWTCSQCGCMLSPKPMLRPGSLHLYKRPVCSRCGPDAKMVQVTIPFAFKYMVAELASVGIATQLSLNDKIEQKIEQLPRRDRRKIKAAP